MIRRAIVSGGTAVIPLTRGYEAVVDLEDLPLVAGQNWFAAVRGNLVYAARNEWQRGEGHSKLLMMHRVILGEPEHEIDHRDGDGLNNRRGNLREATKSQNQRNISAHRDNRSGFKGVSRNGPGWSAAICHKGVRYHLGTHATPEAAHAAYKEAARKMHGEFARAE